MEKINSSILENLKVNQEMEEDININDLTRVMFKHNPKILDKYFRNKKGANCWYCRLPEITQDDYYDFITSYKGRKPKSSLLVNASPYYQVLCRKYILNKDFGVNIDIKGYISNEEHYEFDTERVQDIYEDECWRDGEENVILPNKVSLDEDLEDELYKTIFKAIKLRLLMLLDINKVISMLNNIRSYMSTTGGNPTETMLNSLRSLYRTILNKVNDKDFIEFKSKYNDIDVYAKNEDTYKDYIRTYTAALRMLTDIIDEPLDYMRDIIHNAEDPFEEIILSNDGLEVEEVLYYNTDRDDDEDLAVDKE